MLFICGHERIILQGCIHHSFLMAQLKVGNGGFLYCGAFVEKLQWDAYRMKTVVKYIGYFFISAICFI